MKVSESRLSSTEERSLIAKLNKSRNPTIKFNKLKMYFGRPYTIDLENVDGSITIYPPTLGDIVDYGEEEWYQNLSVLTCNTTSYRYQLSLSDIDWNEISDFEMFCGLYQTIEDKFSQILFHFNLSDFERYFRQKEEENGEVTKIPVLYNEKEKIEINEEVYFHISQYLRNCFHIFPKEEIVDQEALKRALLDKEKANIHNMEAMKKMGRESDTALLPLISSCINHPGFPYTIETLDKLPMFAFMDSVARLQIYESTVAALSGMYSGMCDMSKVPQETFNFMREI